MKIRVNPPRRLFWSLYFSANQTGCECVRSDAAVFMLKRKLLNSGEAAPEAEILKPPVTQKI
jgi:hypothetical protein